MTRVRHRPVLVAARAAFVVALMLTTGASARAAPKPPNIVVFVGDDVGMDFGVYGNRGIKTPHVDALARSGMVFDNAFVTSPQCSPSRTSMLSGRFAHTIGTEDLHMGIDDKTQILPHHLRSAGYVSSFLLKGHIGKNGQRQFDWNDEGFSPDYVAGRWNDKALDNFKSALDKAGDNPFFVWVGFIDAHRPYGDAANAAPRKNAPTQVTVPPYLVDAPATRRDLADYYDEISRMDAHIGQMVDEVERRGLRNDTVIMFVSDHGMPFPRAKGTLYDSGIKVPLVVSWPGRVRPGTRFAGLVSTIDLAPTLADLAGLKADPLWYGKSLLPILDGRSTSGHSHVFAERNWHNTDEHMRCVRTGRWKLILNAYTELPHGTPGDLSTSPAWYDLRERLRANRLKPAQAGLFRAPRPAVELYDLQRDPFEVQNLADRPAHAATVAELVRQLEVWMKETGDHPPHERRQGDRVDRITGAPLPRSWEGPWPATGWPRPTED